MSKQKKSSESTRRRSGNIPAIVREHRARIISLFLDLPEGQRHEIVSQLAQLAGQQIAEQPAARSNEREEASSSSPTRVQNPPRIRVWDRPEIREHPSAVWLREHTDQRTARTQEAQDHLGNLSSALAAWVRGRRSGIDPAAITAAVNAAETVNALQLLWPQQASEADNAEEETALAVVPAAEAPADQQQLVPLVRVSDGINILPEVLNSEPGSYYTVGHRREIYISRLATRARRDNELLVAVSLESLPFHNGRSAPLDDFRSAVGQFERSVSANYAVLQDHIFTRQDGHYVLVNRPIRWADYSPNSSPEPKQKRKKSSRKRGLTD